MGYSRTRAIPIGHQVLLPYANQPHYGLSRIYLANLDNLKGEQRAPFWFMTLHREFLQTM